MFFSLASRLFFGERENIKAEKRRRIGSSPEGEATGHTGENYARRMKTDGEKTRRRAFEEKENRRWSNAILKEDKAERRINEREGTVNRLGKK